jgi:hypothetical protein
LSTIIGDDDDASCNVLFSVIRVDDGKWHMLAITVLKGEGAKIYIDGKNTQNTTFPLQCGDAFNPATGPFIGCSQPLTGTEFWPGDIGFVGILNSRLAPSQIADIYMDPWAWLLPPSGQVFGFRPGIPPSGAPRFLPEQLAFSAFGGMR